VSGPAGEPPPDAPAPKPPAVVSSCASAPPVEEHLITEYGGVFYLINLALFLGLYGDFTCPAHPGLELPIWDFLALLGERLAGEALRADPVWELLARLAGRGPDESPGHDFAPPGIERWLDELMPHVRARLCLALGLADADGLAGLLLAHRARVTVTATHLDVTFGLAELPLAIRLAGLDRDPGWVPAAGRFIAFHFE
jgi:hypothetical protein